MEKRHAVAVRAGPWRPIYELDTAVFEGPQGGLDVRHAVGHVVETRAAPFQKAPDGRIRTERLEQLQSAIARAHETELDALGIHPLAAGTTAARGGFEGREGVIDRPHGDPDVIEGEIPHGVVRLDRVIVQVGLGQEIASNSVAETYG